MPTTPRVNLTKHGLHCHSKYMSNKTIWGTLDPFYEGGEIMGRSVANESFLKTLLTLDPYDEYHFFLHDAALAAKVGGRISSDFPEIAQSGRLLFATRRELPVALEENDYHCFHLSDCINYMGWLAALRNARSRTIFPITGVTHSLSYARYMRDFLGHMWPGCTRRDCVVATSVTGVQVVERVYETLAANMFHGNPPPRPSVRRIPLGVDAQALEPFPQEAREIARREIGIAPDECMLLVFARISHYSKLDLLPVLRAITRLAGHGIDPSKVRLFLSGWTVEGDDYPQVLADFAANLGIRLDVVARPSEELKHALFGAADIFLSPVDNLQETFGLTVLEAGAMALPSVVSDFDGYRDLIAQGETGVLVPTIGPSSTRGVDILANLVFESEYHLQLAQRTAVDIAELARALASLIKTPRLRQVMGRAARRRVSQLFSWQSVVERYVILWDSLWDKSVDPDYLRDIPHPLAMPFSWVFGGYPSGCLDDSVSLQWTRVGEAVYRGQDFVTIYDGIEGVVSPEAVRRVVFFARKPIGGAKLVRHAAQAAGIPSEQAEALVLWALKHDLLERLPADA